MIEALRSNNLLVALLFVFFAVGTISGGLAIIAAVRHLKRTKHRGP